MQLIVYHLGIVGYSDAYGLQRDIRRRVIDNESEDTLLLLEHPPTITVGKSGKMENILASKTELARKGVSLFFVDRGGDVTYHGPGQLVAYPIIDLRKRGEDAHKYVADLEEVVIRTLNDFSIRGSRYATHAGVWVENDEIAAIGISLSKWVTMHGIALNVNVDLKSFSLINPCGFTDREAASMSSLLSRDIPVKEVSEKFLSHFSEVFDTDLLQAANRVLAGGACE
jgi:lipoate-protein ligase B